jgi:hypothetical protein
MHAEPEEEKEKGFFGRLCDAINSNDPHSAIEDDADIREMHEAAEVFDPRAEDVFKYLQVCGRIVSSPVHHFATDYVLLPKCATATTLCSCCPLTLMHISLV